jgi:hypothetical protein
MVSRRWSVVKELSDLGRSETSYCLLAWNNCSDHEACARPSEGVVVSAGVALPGGLGRCESRSPTQKVLHAEKWALRASKRGWISEQKSLPKGDVNRYDKKKTSDGGSLF